MSVVNIKLLVLAVLMGFASLSQAHFQLLYTPDLLLDKPAQLTFKMPFTHPAVSGAVMDVAPVSMVYFKENSKTDLTDSLQPITWQSAANKGGAYEVKSMVKSMGDYVFLYETAPYFEKEEDLYIILWSN